LDLDELIVRHRRELVAAGFFGSGPIEFALLKFGLIDRIGLVPGREVPKSHLLELLDELELPMSMDEAVRGLISDQFLVAGEQGDFTIGDTLDAAAWFGGGAAGLLDEVRVLELKGPDRNSGNVSLRVVLDVLDRNRTWAMEIARSASERNLCGLPVFWNCGNNASEVHRPMADDPGSMATTDALHLCFERVYYGLDARPPSAKADSLCWLWERALDLQVTQPGWDAGAIALPLWDDDFVGTFDASHDSSGCPTVDATGNALLAFCELRRAQAADICDPDGSLHLLDRTVQAVDQIVSCLVRWQSDDGGWAIYHYEPPVRPGWTHPTRDLSTRYAIEGLAAAADLCSFELRSTVNSALARAGRHVQARVEQLLRGEQDANEASDLALAPALAVLTPAFLTKATATMDVQERELLPRMAEVLRSEWRPDHSRYASAIFRVPTWRGPGDRARWELPADPLFVTAIIGLDRVNPCVRDDADTRIMTSVASMLADELHGHWPDFLMQQEGHIRGMTGNTRYYHRAVLDFLGSETSLLPPHIGPDDRFGSWSS
jgi:hypothetical protein